MDYKNRPKIKDLKTRYNYDGFFLSGDGVLGSYVAMKENKRANEIVRSLRKRGYVCMYMKTDFGAYWYIQTKEA